MIRLVLCDDHDLVRTSLVRVLQADGRFNVVAQAGSSEQLLRVLAQDGVDAQVLLLDLNLGQCGLAAGIELIRCLVLSHADLRVVVVSMHDDPEVVSSALLAGALGYVTKDSSFEVLQQAIHTVNQGLHFLCPQLVGPMLLTRTRQPDQPWDATLTRREREVMVRLYAGQRVSEIASALGLSIKTISTHKIRLMEKLNVTSMAGLIKIGVREQIV